MQKSTRMGYLILIGYAPQPYSEINDIYSGVKEISSKKCVLQRIT